MFLYILLSTKKALGFNAKELIKINTLSIILVIIYFIIYVGITYLDLNKHYSFKNIHICQTSIVEDLNKNTLDYIFKKENRVWSNYSQINKYFIDFVITAEDDSFYYHSGIDIKEIKNSIKANFGKRCYSRGASTITQQLVKNLFLDKEKTIIRKLRELSLSLKIEKTLTKKRIIEYYMNVIEWGPGIYGAEAAARYYFDKPNSELSLNQISFLTMIIPNPKKFSPFYRPQSIEFINTKNKHFANRLYNEKNINFEEKQKILSPFNFYKNRNPADLNHKYPKLDIYNYKDKNVIFKDLESYLKKKYPNLYYSSYKISISLNKNRTVELINYLKSIDKYSDQNNYYLPIINNEEKIIALIPILNEETSSLVASLLNENERILEPINSIPWSKIVLTVKKLKTINLN